MFTAEAIANMPATRCQSVAGDRATPVPDSEVHVVAVTSALKPFASRFPCELARSRHLPDPSDQAMAKGGAATAFPDRVQTRLACRPDRASYITRLRLKMSLRPSSGRPFACSGDR